MSSATCGAAVFLDRFWSGRWPTGGPSTSRWATQSRRLSASTDKRALTRR